jgi:hypothetical protein
MRFNQTAIACAIATIIVFKPTTASSVEQHVTTGNYWLGICQSHDVGQASICLAYVNGFAGLHSLPEIQNLFCPPTGVTIGQMKEVVTKYLRDNPAKLHLNMNRLVLNALREAFPCPPR